MAPILVLGEKSVEKQKDVERLRGEHTTAQSKLDSARAIQQKAERDFDQFCINRASVIRDTLRSSGQNPYNNYNKTDFRGAAQKMAGGGDAQAHRLSGEDRDRLLAQQRATPKPKVQELAYALPNFEAIVARLSGLLRTTIVSAAIEALKADATLAAWTREGLRLHSERNADRCLFCEQPLPKDRLAALDAHFSAQYEQFMRSLDQFIDELQKSSEAASDLRLPKRAELYDDLAAEFEAAEAGLTQALKATREFLDSAVQALEDKSIERSNKSARRFNRRR